MPGPRRSSQCAGPASRARAARRQAALAGSAYRRCAAVFQQNSTQRRCADPTGCCRRANSPTRQKSEADAVCPPGLHCRTAPAPAAPQRPRRSTALRAPGHGDAAPGAVQRKVKQAVAAGRNAQAPDVPANALGLPAEPEQHAGKQPCGISVSPLRGSFSTKTLRSGDALIPQAAAGDAHRLGSRLWASGRPWGRACCPPGLHCRTAPAPAAPQRPRRSTALRAPGHGDAAPGAVQHPK